MFIGTDSALSVLKACHKRVVVKDHILILVGGSIFLVGLYLYLLFDEYNKNNKQHEKKE